MTVFYRYTDSLVSAGVDEFDNSLGPGYITVYLNKYNVIKTTPKGVWISYACDKKFILLSARKKFACATIEEARQSFIARKTKQASIYAKRHDNALKAIQLVNMRNDN